MRNVPALKGEMPSKRNQANHRGGSFSSQVNKFLLRYWPGRKSRDPTFPGMIKNSNYLC